jgi:hypothetical protein
MQHDRAENILLPADLQNTEWFQVSAVTVVHWEIIHEWHCRKQNDPGVSIQSFANSMAKKWGISDRASAGSSPALNQIPQRQRTRETVHVTSGGARHILSEKRTVDAIVKGSIVSIINNNFKDASPKCVQYHCDTPNTLHAKRAVRVVLIARDIRLEVKGQNITIFLDRMHRKVMAYCRCSSRINFLGDADKVAAAFASTFDLLNLKLFTEHVKTCPDPTCGAVFCIDGTCKVFRETCGAELPPPAAELYDAAESDVHNAFSNGFLREKVCAAMPTRTGNKFYANCKERTKSVPQENRLIVDDTEETETNAAPVNHDGNTGENHTTSRYKLRRTGELPAASVSSAEGNQPTLKHKPPPPDRDNVDTEEE